ncbi:MAG: NADPH:quinone reductase [Alphaproteobacteria bacterium]|nr:NADPH:quinone reductase [Alphaproteobacteria bacterium]
MRAAWYERTGPAAEVLTVGTMPDPVAGPGDVLVRVRASGVNPSDTKQRAGWRGAKPAFPRIVPHADGAGEIVAVGPGGDARRIGTRVWIYNGVGLYDARRAFGTAAELIAVPDEQAVPLPDPMSFAEGACLGVPAETAHRAVFADGSVEGQTILVAGGAGAVAHYAIQFAKLGGARVIATVSSPAKAAHAQSAGADVLIDRRQEDVAARVLALTDGIGVDRIVEVDLGANLPIDAKIIRTNGVIASYSSTAVPEPAFPYYPLAFKGVTLRLVQGYNLPPAARRDAIAAIARHGGAGRLTHAIARRFPLAEIARAHEYLESGQAIGNVVVEI